IVEIAYFIGAKGKLVGKLPGELHDVVIPTDGAIEPVCPAVQRRVADHWPAGGEQNRPGDAHGALIGDQLLMAAGSHDLPERRVTLAAIVRVLMDIDDRFSGGGGCGSEPGHTQRRARPNQEFAAGEQGGGKHGAGVNRAPGEMKSGYVSS